MNRHPFDYERLKRALALAGNTPGREQWTAEEWLKLADAYAASGWDITPDQWSSAQIADAIERGRPPCFDDGLPSQIHARDPRLLGRGS